MAKGHSTNSILFNFLMNATLMMSYTLFPLITFPYATRILGAKGIGAVGFATSFVAFFLMFSQLGIPTYGIKICASVRDDKEELSRTVHELLVISLVMTAITYVAFALCIGNVARLEEDKDLLIIVSGTILLSTLGMEWLYSALEQYRYITIRSIGFKVIAVIALFIFVRREEDCAAYAVITIFASSASYIMNLINARKYISFQFLGGYNWKRHMKPIMVLFFLVCATKIYTNLDTVMLGFIKSDIDVGYYNAAIKVKTMLVSIITSLGAVLLPRVSYYVQNGMIEEFERVRRKAVSFIILISVPTCIFFMVEAKEAIFLLCGAGFSEAVLPMQIIMPTIILIGITNIIGMEILIPLGKEKLVLYSTMLGALTDLLFNVILIPTIGASGAAIGTVAAELVVLIAQLWYVRKDLKDLFSRCSFRTLLAGNGLACLAAGICIWVFKEDVLRSGLSEKTAFIHLLIASVAYFGTYGLSLLVMREKLVVEVVFPLFKKSWEYIGKIRIPIIPFDRWHRMQAFLLAYMAHVAALVISSTVYGSSTVVSKILLLIRLTSVMVVLIKLIYDTWDRIIPQKRLLTMGGLSILFLIVAEKSGVKQMFFFWIFIMGAHDVDYRSIIKAWLGTNAAIMTPTWIAALLGVIENRLYFRSSFGDISDKERWGLGFSYPTESPNLLFYMTLGLLVVRREKITWKELIVLSLLDLFLFRNTDTKSAFALTLTALLLTAVYKLTYRVRTVPNLFVIAACTIIPGLMGCFLAVSRFGNVYKGFVRALNGFLSGRIALSKAALEKYPITALGQTIRWVGGGDTYFDKTLEYNYVDSSYIQHLLSMGYLFMILLICWLSILLYKAVRKKDAYLFSAVVLMAIHATFDPQLIWMQYDVFLLMGSYIFDSAWNRKLIEPGKSGCLIERDSRFQMVELYR